MMPDIEHLGHACIKFTNAGVSLTSDPWFYSAFLHGWFPYPNNRHLLENALDSDYIYISHAHEDHFDREFLRQVDPTRTTLIIPQFRSHYLERELAKLGFEGNFAPIILGHEQGCKLPGDIHVRLFLDRSHKEDSALLVETSGFRFLNANDCELAIPDWPKGVNVLACQYSGATWYPQCYDFDFVTMAQKIYTVRRNNMERLFRRIKLTEAKSYLPSAGPAVFLDPALDRFNSRNSIFPHWEDVASGFCCIFPEVVIHPYLNNYTDINEYRRTRRSEWSRYYAMSENLVTQEELGAHFIDLQKRNKRFLREWHKDISITSSHHWPIKLGLVADQLEEMFNPEYFMNIPPRVLRALVNGHITWETALISHRIQLSRNPDVYDSTLMGLLNFGDRPIQTTTMAKQRNADETVQVGGYEVQRWCPHAGEDLSGASVNDGKLVCPRHEWSWDLKTGECLSGGDIPLNIRRSE